MKINISKHIALAKDIPIASIPLPIYAEPKYDGVRIITIINKNNITLYTRNNKVVYLPLIEKLLLQTFKTNPDIELMLDGELIFNNGECSLRSTISGYVNSIIHNGQPEQKYNLTYVIFDILPLHEFISKSSQKTYLARKNILQSFITEYKRVSIKNNLFVQITPSFYEYIDTHDKINQLFEKQLQNGLEGLIIKSPITYYPFGRTKYWVKLKSTNTIDLKCVAVIKGKGKYENMVGALVCSDTYKNKLIKVKVGSGLTDNLRNKDFSFFQNKIIEVAYNQILLHKYDYYTLFLPRFVCIREDK